MKWGDHEGSPPCWVNICGKRNERFTRPEARAGQRGLRMLGLRMTVWRNTRVKSNTVLLQFKKMGARLAPRTGFDMFRPGGAGRGTLRRKKDAGPLEQGKFPAALEGLPDEILG